MTRRGPFQIPATSTLIAFESAARHGNFSRAAEELHTSQSAISRHIAKLEGQLATRVFERSRTGVSLTEAGVRLRDAVSDGLRLIHRGVLEAGEMPSDAQVVIACSHDSWQLVCMPRLDALRKALGDNVRVRARLYHRDLQTLQSDPNADVVFTWSANRPGPAAFALKEAVRPVCSSGYAADNADVLNGPVNGWGALTFLDFAPPDRCWASWADWFQVESRPDRDPRLVELDSYTHVVEAAAAGRGIALGRRYHIERYLDTGALVTLAAGFVEFDNFFCGLLTEKGRAKPFARRSLTFFDESARS